MSKRQGFDKEQYDSGYERGQRKRRDRIRGWEMPDEHYEEDRMTIGPEPEEDPGFVERNNVRDRL